MGGPLGRHSHSVLCAFPTSGRISHSRGSGNTLSLHTPFSPPGPLPLLTSLSTPQGYLWSPPHPFPWTSVTLQQAWQGHEMRDGAGAVALVWLLPQSCPPSYTAGFSVLLAMIGDMKWLEFKACWRAASRLAQRAWPMRYSLSRATSERRKSNSRRVLLSDMPSRSCFPPSWERSTRIWAIYITIQAHTLVYIEM